jgi:hypothetical protein
MSLHFQIDIALDLKDDVDEAVIMGLRNLCDNQTLTQEQKKVIPNIFKYISLTDRTNSFYGPSCLALENHYRYSQRGVEVSRWTLHLRQVFVDDLFYEQGYVFIAWLATISETEGFVGYLKEELAQDPVLLYFYNQEVVTKESTKNTMKFKLGDFSSDFQWED